MIDMLKRWLSPAAHLAFRESRQRAQAFAIASVPAIAPALFDWSELDRVLRAQPTPDAIVVRRNELLDLPVPRNEPAVRQLFEQKIGLVVRHAQTRSAGLLALATQFAEEFATGVHIQLFVTPAGSHGFGWHYDPDDVIILQTTGRKEVYFRANTQAPELASSTPDFSLVLHETSPLLKCTMCAGDALYLPRGMWHAAHATEDALSISLGLTR